MVGKQGLLIVPKEECIKGDKGSDASLDQWTHIIQL